MKKKIFAGLLALSMSVVMLSGCGGSDKPATQKDDDKKTTTQKKDEKLKIEVIAKGFQHQFWKAVELGTKKAAKEFGAEVTFQGPDNESAIAQQVEYFNTAIEKRPSAICLAALDTKAMLDAIKTAQQNNIPIVGFDSGVPNAPEGAIKATASTDNYRAGSLAAEKMYEIIKEKVTDPENTVRIGVVSQEANSQSIVARTTGFVDKMVELIGKDKASVEGHESTQKIVKDAKVIIDVSIPAEVRDDAGTAVASALLQKNDLIAIYGSNEFAANAIITANEGIDKLAKDKIIAVGFDAGQKQLDAVKDGRFVGSVTQNPVEIGYQAVKLAVESVKGQTVKDVDTGALWYNAENMEQADIEPLLYR